MPQLDPSHFLSQIFWLVITFTILFVYLKFFILPKIQNIINERESSSKLDYEKTAALKDEITKMQQEVAKQHRMTAEQVEQLHKSTETEIRLAKEEHLRKLNANFVKQQEHLLNEISEAREASEAEIKNYVIDYAALFLTKIIGAKPDSKDLEKYYSKIEARS